MADDPLSHIPHLPMNPVTGHTLQILKDSYGFHHRNRAQFHGPYRFKVFGDWRVCLPGLAAMDLVLHDRDRIFSSREGWKTLHGIFDGGLALRDFEDHRRHRRIMQSAFRVAALQDYAARMDAAFGAALAGWPRGAPFAFYPRVKALTLRLGNQVLMGLDPDDPRSDGLNRAFTAEVAASMGLIRTPLPLTKMWRGQRSRAQLARQFLELIAQRRTSGGSDFFSQMCRARDEDGQGWTDDEIVDHFNFLLVAAHDTTASGLTSMVAALAQHPDWQQRVIDEVTHLDGQPLTVENLGTMVVTDRVFREAIRLRPPVPFIPRRALRDFSWPGEIVPAGTPPIRVPAGTRVLVCPGIEMMSPEFFAQPDQFDPDRFTPDRAEDRAHPMAWAPFGAGAHKCIGLHFATLQIKAFAVALLRHHRVRLAADTPSGWAHLPIPKPKDGLPIELLPKTG
ncbi:cytochrome P450 [Actibacterium sp. 188UL27-1]|uniref:cytochrome P450 n=1 Tax=Actibacterium sp. 188UL27-1 TaxID=2786961 RepID=UPI001958C8AC|nr:cytochrome P450 [Actibacterium sp. 188UL27-1]MBM7068146.1 cytochrome P450 [Actibacterium sp. 188UL27-1]